MRRAAIVAAGLAVGLAPGAACAAPEPARAPAQAQPCAVCHGNAGLASAPDTPHLAGQPRIYLAAQLKAFRSGARRHEVMNVVAKPLSDADIAVLAEWYAGFEVDVRPRR